MQIAVLGGTGSLGSAVTAAAIAAGHTVVAISRRAPAQLPAGVRHAVADVTTGVGLPDAFAGADVVIDGTNATKDAETVLVTGTERVLEAARRAHVRHFVGISIVGIDTAPLAYYRTKVAQERVIEATAMPWTLQRATQFHDLIPRFSTGRLGIVIAPRGAKFQPIDVREVAVRLVEAAENGPCGRLPDIGGPEVVELADLARAWARAAYLRRWVLSPPVPGKLAAFLRAGSLCCPERAVGRLTFAQWLAERYPV